MSEEEHEHDKGYRDGWAEFNELVAEAAEYVFGEEAWNRLALVVAGQWGEVGDESRSLVSANVPPCLVLSALEVAEKTAHTAHEKYHVEAMQAQIGDGYVVESLTYAQASDEIKEAMAEMAEEIGMQPDEIKFFEVADMSDLEDLPPEDLRRGHEEEE